MNQKFQIPLLTLGTLAMIGTGCNREDSKPNIIFILADDFGWSQTAVYGSNYYHTPNIDRLASEGIRFNNAYAACSVSSPTRASIMTGKYPARLHLTDFIAGNNRDDYRLSQPVWQKFLPLEEVTLAEMLKENGYKTALFGKWHLSVTKFGPESLPYNPDKQGFDQYFVIDKPDKGTNPENDPHKSDSIGNRSVEFLRENARNPFFLFVSFSAIHNPLMEKADSINWWKNVTGSDKQENNPVIAAMLSRMDRNIGKILDAVDEQNMAKKTIIIFFSDNGGLENDAKQTPLRRGKGWLYEGGIRVPLIIRWPEVIAKGLVSDEVVSSIDFMPTFSDLIDGEKKSDADGISILSYLKTETPLPERNLYWHYPHYHNGPPCGAIRSGKWKLIEWYEKSLLESGESPFELYDLENDISESVNLADSLKILTMKLSGDLQRWRKDVNAQMPVPNTKFQSTKNN
jgi:uncharacterized sulfatase